MTSQIKLSSVSFNNILLATDFSPESLNALQYAVSLAKRYGATIFLTHALPPESSLAAAEPRPAPSDTMRHNAEQNMASLESREDLRRCPHEVIVRSGDTWQVISQVLSNKKIDLVVVGTHGHGGIKKLFLGSTAESVVRHATCPVLTVGPHVRPAQLDRFGQILYATDFSTGSRRALTYALSLAEGDRGKLTLLHVIQCDTVSESQLLTWKQQDREKLSAMIPPEVDLAYAPEIEVGIGIPEAEIVRLANSRKAELIVMGSHSGGAVSTHVPWTAVHHILQHAPCPVLTLRGTPSPDGKGDPG